MSFIVSTGADAVEEALKPKTDYSKALVSLKAGAGNSVKVRVLPNAVVKYFAHSAYKTFYTTPCTKPMGQEDLYDKACDLLYKDAKAAEDAGVDSKEVEKMKNYAYGLKAKERYMIGFVRLSDGLPIVVDFTGKQGKALIALMKKQSKHANAYAFELEKSGSSTDTQVALTLVLDMDDDLKDKEKEHFEKSAGHEFNMEIFENVLQINDEKKQLEDIHAYGFDVTRLGFEVPTKNPNAGNEQSKPNDEEF